MRPRAALVAATAVLVGCVGRPVGVPASPVTSDRSSTPTVSPSPGVFIAHATGGEDLLLRLDEIGGFVAPGVIVTRAPLFSLYGDGTVIYRDPDAPVPSLGLAPPGVVLLPPLRRTWLSERELQGLLAFALDEGGLRGAASGTYDQPGIADAPTTVFELHAGGLDRRLLVYALGIAPGGPGASPADALLRARLARLADALTRYRPPAGASVATYRPERFRVALVTPSAGVRPGPWPWPDLDPTSFSPGSCGATAWPCRVVDRSRVTALLVVPPDGGLDGLVVEGPDGRRYGIAVRPLLPDEPS